MQISNGLHCDEFTLRLTNDLPLTFLGVVNNNLTAMDRFCILNNQPKGKETIAKPQGQTSIGLILISSSDYFSNL